MSERTLTRELIEFWHDATAEIDTASHLELQQLCTLALRGLLGLDKGDAHERSALAELEADVKRLEAIIAPITGGEVDDLEGTDEQIEEISTATVFWETRGQIHEQSGSISPSKIAAIFNAIVQMRVKERK